MRGADIETEAETIQQACVVPLRRKGDRLQVCLITSIKKRRWILPKGIIDPGESCEEAGLKEALEEAGIRGHIVGDTLGVYDDAKWGRSLRVSVMLMAVTDCDDEWLESDMRDRRWVSPQRAARMLSKPSLGTFLDIAVSRYDE